MRRINPLSNYLEYYPKIHRKVKSDNVLIIECFRCLSLCIAMSDREWTEEGGGEVKKYTVGR